MKNLKEHIYNNIIEGLKIGANTKVNTYKYHPKNTDELEELVDKLIRERGMNADLNDIDVSAITDMSYLFYNSEFNGDISKWNVSNVAKMYSMFYMSKFNGDISEWNVSNVDDMANMFEASKFDKDISAWNVSNVKHMSNMFDDCPLKNNPPKWYKKWPKSN